MSLVISTRLSELFQAWSERPFTLLEMPPIVIVTISSVFYTKEQGKMLDGKGKEMLLT